ncbi:MAG: hypothetical protein FWD85_13640 [Microbacteriaceae bacterium]|nr:hypothetical protein [Microbacteriaceae bacterium]
MLYANAFIGGGTLAAVVALAACYNVLDDLDAAAAEAAASAGEAPASAEPMGAADADALQFLSDTLGTRVLWRHQLREPDERIAQDAQLAAFEATGDVREKLLELADAAQRSTLEFLVHYNLAVGAWQQRSGVVMGSPVLARREA